MENNRPRSRSEKRLIKKAGRRRVRLAFALIFLSILIFPLSTLAVRAKVPKLVGKGLTELQATIKSAKLGFTITGYEFSDDLPKDAVISQEPAPGSRVKRGQAVKVVLSQGPEPKVTAQTLEVAPQETSLKEETETQAKPVEEKTEAEAPPAKEEAPQKVPTAPVKIICIDPGHQSKANPATEPIGPGSNQTKAKVTGGTSGASSKTPEYQINLEVSLKLKKALEASGYKVVMTREKNEVNISNARRAELANEAKADLVVRIHADGNSNPEVKGISVLYPAKNAWTGGFYLQSKEAAQTVLASLIKATGAKNNGIVARNDITGFNWSERPVILVEMGYLSNKDEDKLLNDEGYQNKLAQGILSGINSYFSGKRCDRLLLFK